MEQEILIGGAGGLHIHQRRGVIGVAEEGNCCGFGAVGNRGVELTVNQFTAFNLEAVTFGICVENAPDGGADHTINVDRGLAVSRSLGIDSDGDGVGFHHGAVSILDHGDKVGGACADSGDQTVLIYGGNGIAFCGPFHGFAGGIGGQIQIVAHANGGGDLVDLLGHGAGIVHQVQRLGHIVMEAGVDILARHKTAAQLAELGHRDDDGGVHAQRQVGCGDVVCNTVQHDGVRQGQGSLADSYLILPDVDDGAVCGIQRIADADGFCVHQILFCSLQRVYQSGQLCQRGLGLFTAGVKSVGNLDNHFVGGLPGGFVGFPAVVGIQIPIQTDQGVVALALDLGICGPDAGGGVHNLVIDLGGDYGDEISGVAHNGGGIACGNAGKGHLGGLGGGFFRDFVDIPVVAGIVAGGVAVSLIGLSAPKIRQVAAVIADEPAAARYVRKGQSGCCAFHGGGIVTDGDKLAVAAQLVEISVRNDAPCLAACHIHGTVHRQSAL